MSKIIVVGSNHAGTAAIKTILGNYEGNEVVVYDKNNNISFLGCGMALWIGNQISGAEGLFYATKESLEEMGAKVHMEADVHKIDFENKKVYVTLSDGTEVEDSYDKIILATGSLPIIPTIPGKDLENVQQVKLYQNAAEVIKKLENPEIKDITVVGAGYIGVELAEAFERHGKNVTMVDIADTCLPAYYDEPFTSLMKKNLEDHNINLEFGQAVQEIKGENGKVTAVVTDKKEIKADMVILSIGFRPNNALGKDSLELFRNGAYLVNKKQETSIKDVYAIGDCATVYDNTIDDRNYIALATNAVRSGIVAAHNAAGTEIESIGVQGSNGISIYDLKMVSTGITVAKAEKLGIEVGYTDFEDLQKPAFIETSNPSVKLRIVYDKKTRVVLGAQMASEYDMSMGIHMFSLAIQEKVTIERLALLDIFFLPHFNQPYNYITMAAITAK
ncbi:MAG: FAD-dependent oxidoreductase [Peptostreptococcus porci]|uniref:NADH oxidase n=1 Tax=Peptostreptococcus porci TaxID=2652282 RepID=A0A6N7XHI6_9FIRM|nr:FAD-dependent oxidoreductase [Peptostreptococcus porci]MDY2794497.1 FAD-dependent oxidoreductase [Peptostreptococcus porci]MDY5479017.1 FAD-dependent oxidoreductase [Peptostreptococcus porci]MDY6231623.1 FAD-dependent oxidoreductase [Peptostreptococcus porci]MST63083.1 SidA/IucD/PvdA family monooxygenase [Peptostreptococcus porci]